MAFSISEITGKLKKGGARPTLFQVVMSKTDFPDLRNLSPFFIQSAQIPSSTITAIEVPYFGRKIKVAGDRTFDTWTVTILNDEDFALRHIFETWHNKINSLYSNQNLYDSAAPSNYKTDATVTQFSKTGPPQPNPLGGEAVPTTGNDAGALRTYMFSGLFPTEISPIDLSWDATDQIESFSVTFAYDYFEVVSGSTGTIGQSGSEYTS